jgi:Xaa-Pro aminopeptidase
LPFPPQRTSSPGADTISFQFSSRLNGLRESIFRKKIKGFLVTDLVNIRYLSGFRGSSAFILLTRKKNVFVTDFRYREQASGELSGTDGRAGETDWDIVIEKGGRLKTIRNLVHRFGIGVLGFESTISYESYEGLLKCGVSLVPLKGYVEKIREVKDREELRFIKDAVKRAEDAFVDIKGYIRQGAREKAIALRLEERLEKRGCNHLPIEIIVASGANSAMPHARASEKKLSPGDLVVVDWGGESGGYCSDMTRTLLLRGGNLSKKKEIYSLVLRANMAAVAAAVPGIETRVVDKAARDVIKRAGYDKFFGHGTGHGVGLEVHELPRVTWTKSESIKEGMVFTIEPGIYMEGMGGVRIEDMILVKAKGAELLTGLPRKLEVI